MKYFKSITTGAVVKASAKPTGDWCEVTIREYDAYRAWVIRVAGRLDRAVAYKSRLLKR